MTFRVLHTAAKSAGLAFVIPNPWDAGLARMLAALGFPALATTSAGMAFALGIREAAATPNQTLAHCRQIVAATKLPVNADLESGFGQTPESAARTILQAAETGIAYGHLIRAAQCIATNGTFEFTDDAMGFAEIEGYLPDQTPDH